MRSTFCRIGLAVVFCLGMLVTANPAALGQRDRGERRKCERECQQKYNEQVRECNGKRGRERRECRDRATKDLRECRNKCRH